MVCAWKSVLDQFQDIPKLVRLQGNRKKESRIFPNARTGGRSAEIRSSTPPVLHLSHFSSQERLQVSLMI